MLITIAILTCVFSGLLLLDLLSEAMMRNSARDKNQEDETVRPEQRRG